MSRYREHFPTLFRGDKWRPLEGAPLWTALFGAKLGPLSLVGRSNAARRSLSRLLRVESLEARQMLAANVFVNDNWVEVTNGPGTPGVVDQGDTVNSSADPDPSVIGGVFGVDAFTTIQQGVDNVDNGGTVHVAGGTYNEEVVIDRPMNVRGNQADVDARNRQGQFESKILQGVYITADDVTLNGFSVTNTDTDAGGVDDGVAVTVTLSSDNVDILNNIIADAEAGIALNGSNLLVDQNWIRDNDSPGPDSGRGIVSNGIAGAIISDNLVEGHPDAAMAFTTVAALDILNNEIGASGNNLTGGIIFSIASDIDVASNKFTSVEGNAITASGGVSSLAVTGNTFTNGRGREIRVQELLNTDPNSNLTISNNTVVKNLSMLTAARPSIEISNEVNGSLSITNNTLTYSGAPSFIPEGIVLNGFGSAVTNVAGNMLSGGNVVNATGIRVAGSTSATLTNNTVSGFGTGIAAVETAGNAVTLDLGNGQITGGQTGLFIEGGVSLAGNTLGSLAFTGQGANYIRLESGAFDNQTINATNVTFDGLLAVNMNSSQRAALENKLFHEPDDSTLGLIVVDALGEDPIAVNDNFSTAEDTPVTGNVLTNDIDPQNDPLTVTNVTGATHGSLVFSANGSFTYTPAKNFFGVDSFMYTVSDPAGNADTATVTISVTSVNDVEANDDAFNTSRGTAVSGNVLTNDRDPEGDPLTVGPFTQPANGTVAMNSNGSFTYTPTAGFSGTDTFTYTAQDNRGASDTALVTITVDDLNDPPNAVNDTASVLTNSQNNVIPVLANDTDPEGDPLTVVGVSPPMHGTVAVGGGGVSYTPAANFFGTDSFTYTITDGEGGFDTATVTVMVRLTTNEPVAVDDSFTIQEDTSLTLTQAQLKANDFDPGAATITAVSDPINGSVSLNPNGTITFTPPPNFFGTAGFNYTLTHQGNSDQAHVTVTVTAVEDPPVVGDDVLDTTPGTPVSVTTTQLLANDVDPEGNALSVTGVSGATGGTVTLNASTGVITYTPNQGFSGIGGFNYTVTDGTTFATGHVTVNVASINQPPLAGDDKFSTAEDTARIFTPAQLLANDTDPDGDAITITAVGDAVNGTVARDSKTGEITFTPAADFSGTGSFTYTIADSRGGADTATVELDVTPVNDPPNAVNDTVIVPEDTRTRIDVLANDTDVDAGDTLTVISVSTPAHGNVAVGPDGVFYTPNENFTGNDSFTYTVRDQGGATDTATVTLTVTAVGDAPNARNDTATVDENSVNNPINVLANDSDEEGDPFTVTAVTQGANGIVTIAPGGTHVLYTPDPNFPPAGMATGTDAFTYTITDAEGESDTATVTVTVQAVADRPNAVNDTATVNEDSGPNVINVRANDTDPEGGTLTITAVTQGANGRVEIRPGGLTLVYIPNLNSFGTDTFTYTVTNGSGQSDTATVTVTVVAADDPPNAVNDTATVNEASTNNVIPVLANDNDPDGDPVTVTAVTDGANGTTAIGPNGLTVLYTPNPQFVGTDTFTYTISDGEGGTDTATVTVEVLDGDSDFVGTAGDDVFFVRLDASGTNVQVFNNATASGTPIFSDPLASLTSLKFDTLGGNDTLIIDFVNGNPMPAGGMEFLGGSNTAAGDRLVVRNVGTPGGSYTASATTTGSGTVMAGGRNISLTGVEPIDVSGFSTFTIVTPNADDTLSITSPAADTAQLSGTSGAVTLSPVTFNKVGSFVINAAANDAGDGDDVLTLAPGRLIPDGVGFLDYRSGTGANTLNVQNGSTRINSTVAAGGTLDTTLAAGAELITHRFRQNSLTLGDGSRATLLAGATSNGVSVLNSLSVGDGTLDINDNAVILDYTGASPLAEIRAEIVQGRGGVGLGNGTWTGRGISSSVAAAANALEPEARSIGYAENATLPLGSYTSFRGQAVDNTSILIAFTRTGDVDLDSVVGDNDVTVLGATYAPGEPKPSWALADLDYNGFVDDNDATLMGAFYNPTVMPLAAAAPAPLAAAGEAVFAEIGGGSSSSSTPGGVSVSAADLAALADEIFAGEDSAASRKTKFGV